ncbi:PREDICTED: uncharacterized protein LOC105363887 [Ceratosolen solmsi marchali]|uniref:Uncharacterized protein LOC105363887 n=1 Tax=Ceratosolen solmsi marchali TaxID=326594 RepID=A0AAJ7DXG7_9HYME|nr:PREDICTED: uncharacterized protein LOC105363887 [Ceratosolen solmsi marchali]
MLAYIFRGFFLIGILSWYSMSLWKMIDSYFKDQFQRYLDEEYVRNPKMREDIHLHTAVDKLDKLSTDAPHEQCNQLLNCTDDVGLIGQTERELGPPDNSSTEAGVDEGDQEKKEEDEKRDESQTPYCIKCDEDDDAETPKERNEPPPTPPTPPSIAKKIDDKAFAAGREETEQLSLFDKTEESKRNQMNERDKEEQEQHQKSTKRRWSNGLGVGAKSERTTNSNKKLRQGMHVITFRDDKFKSVTRKRRVTKDEDGWDFAEFLDEGDRALRDKEEEEDVDAGISLADLPYKPLIDVYDLQRFSQEEFCPLTLEDDTSCDEARSWP